MKYIIVGMILSGVLLGCGKEVKVWKEEYSDGKTKEEYQYYHHPDTNRKIKDGWYNSYYRSGDYHEIGIYKDDIRDGKWSYFRQ